MKYYLIGLSLILNMMLVSQTETQILVERPFDFEYLSAPDSTGKRIFLNTAVVQDNKKTQSNNIKLPYPIIFIHGLNSSAETFTTTTFSFLTPQYGLVNGGRFDYCLNFDGNYSTANTNFYPTANADIAVFSGTWIAGDFYYVNFDTGIDGAFSPSSSASNQVQSNQSAVVKQGRAVRDAILRVRQLTGRDKVILMGHSMGGLAAREYLQNTNLWLPDGNHHVAKLVTTGTPHGGSNASFSILNTVFLNINNQSEAVRDLRENYFYSGSPGVYLYGGTESNTVCDDMLSYYFTNVDVNCNGSIGNNVVGLNSKTLYNNLDYACIIGTSNPLNGGDGVVDDQNASLATYYSLPTPQNTFSVSVSHTSLPAQIYENMQGLDEPNEYLLAYKIGFDSTYTGFTTVQPVGGYSYDFDDYKFTVTGNNVVTVNVANIGLTNLVARIVETNTNNIVAAYQSNGSSSMTFTQTLSSGNYYLEIYGTPTGSSYLSPYNFTLSKTPSIIGINELTENLNNISIYPNPSKNQLTIDSEIYNSEMKIEIFNTLGQEVYNTTLNNSKTTIDISQLSSNVYLMKIISGSSFTYKKFVKE